MDNEMSQTVKPIFFRWLIATTIGWLLGFFLILILGVLWDMIGGGAQFMIGIGMGTGVGYMQSRIVGAWQIPTQSWLWRSIIGLGIPFVLWDIGTVFGFSDFFSLPICILFGGLIAGILQQRLLRAQFKNASWWIITSIVGWGLPVGVIILGDYGVLTGPWKVLSVIAMFFGGIILGLITGKVLIWLPKNSAEYKGVIN